MIFPLKPTKQKTFTKNIYGFDTETANKNKDFVLGSIVGDNFKKVFYDKRNMINYFKRHRFRNSFVVATNLDFDFRTLFYGEDEESEFYPIYRGSQLLLAKSYIYNNKFNLTTSKSKNSITFLDTLNYARMSVENLGKLIKIPKLKKPKALGRFPENKEELIELETYNIRDSEVSYKAMEFFRNSFYSLGSDIKYTIGSTAMSLFKNKYLKGIYFRHKDHVLEDIFKGLYGGRTETFARGNINNENYKLYDVNSLYPYCMLREFPNPNTLRYSNRNTVKYIDSFDGMSLVDIHCPYMQYPYLAFRGESKLLFPCGTFKGYYTHFELRKALDLGYVIKKVYHTYYYTENCYPFTDFVSELYDLRNEYKEIKSPMEKVVKLILNNLYGKFGQKFILRDNFINIGSMNAEKLSKYDNLEHIPGTLYARIQETTKPSAFCMPIWASYVTAYGRDYLHSLIKRYNAIYSDTDSIVTKREISTSSALGKLKLEMNIKKGLIVKPKLYMIFEDDDNFKVSAKGIQKKLGLDGFFDLMQTGEVTYEVFTRMKEAVRRGFYPNQIREITKKLSFNDDKRKWDSEFNTEFQMSKPLFIDESFKSDLDIGVGICKNLLSDLFVRSPT